MYPLFLSIALFKNIFTISVSQDLGVLVLSHLIFRNMFFGFHFIC